MKGELLYILGNEAQFEVTRLDFYVMAYFSNKTH